MICISRMLKIEISKRERRPSSTALAASLNFQSTIDQTIEFLAMKFKIKDRGVYATMSDKNQDVVVDINNQTSPTPAAPNLFDTQPGPRR